MMPETPQAAYDRAKADCLNLLAVLQSSFENYRDDRMQRDPRDWSSAAEAEHLRALLLDAAEFACNTDREGVLDLAGIGTEEPPTLPPAAPA